MDAEERDEMLRQMAIRRYARLTKGTVTEIGVNLDANQVLYGDFQFTPSAESAAAPAPATGTQLRGTIRIQAQILNIREVNRGPVFAVSGPLLSPSLPTLYRSKSELSGTRFLFLRARPLPLEDCRLV